jgi:ribosomal protein S18 acetylase RimI-like enzyme
MPVEVRTLGARDAESVCGGVVDAYRRAWRATMFWPGRSGVNEFGSRILRHSGNPDFRLCVASIDAVVIGFAYGYTSVPGGWWRETVAAELDRAEAGYWFDDCFEVAELAVVPPHQRRGLGRRLHDLLLTDLPHRTSLLSTQMDNAPATRFYLRLGWSVLRSEFAFPNRPHPYLIMGMTLQGGGPGEPLGGLSAGRCLRSKSGDPFRETSSEKETNTPGCG